MSGLHYDSIADLPVGMQAQVAGKVLGAEAAKRSKYGNQKTTANGITFDSKKESERYLALLDAVAEGVICDLRLQVDFTLQEAYTTAEGKRVRAIRYRADFTYKICWDGSPLPCCIGIRDMAYWKAQYPGAMVIEDVKSRGTRTKEYEIKKKLMADRGYEIREV